MRNGNEALKDPSLIAERAPVRGVTRPSAMNDFARRPTIRGAIAAAVPVAPVELIDGFISEDGS